MNSPRKIAGMLYLATHLFLAACGRANLSPTLTPTYTPAPTPTEKPSFADPRDGCELKNQLFYEIRTAETKDGRISKSGFVVNYYNCGSPLYSESGKYEVITEHKFVILAKDGEPLIVYLNPPYIWNIYHKYANQKDITNVLNGILDENGYI